MASAAPCFRTFSTPTTKTTYNFVCTHRDNHQIHVRNIFVLQKCLDRNINTWLLFVYAPIRGTTTLYEHSLRVHITNAHIDSFLVPLLLFWTTYIWIPTAVHYY